MNSESIYDAITDIDEKYIIEAKQHRFIKPRKMPIHWYAIAAALVLVLGIGGYMLFFNSSPSRPGVISGGSNSGSSQPDSGASPSGGAVGGGGFAGSSVDRVNADGSTVFMSYAGPVLPLSVTGSAEGIKATRDITLDFSNFGKTDSNSPFMHNTDVKITDSYVLTNETADDMTIEILYPFTGNFSDLRRLLPVITAGDSTLETGLKAGVYSGGYQGTGPNDAHMALNLNPISKWEDYETLLSDGDYLKRTLDESEALTQIVTVYEFSNVQTANSKGEAPTLAARFSLDFGKTKVLTYGFNGSEWDNSSGFMRQSFFAERHSYQINLSSSYLIIVGEDISNMTIQGYENGGCYAGQETDVKADVTRYEIALSDMLTILIDDFMGMFNEDRIKISEYSRSDDDLSTAMLYRAAVELLFDYGALADKSAFRYQAGSLDEIFSETTVMDRIFYMTAEISIPAGQSIALRIDMIKPASFDFYGSGSGYAGLRGYDIMTALGSNLVFSSMTAGLICDDNIEVIRQNFGFDLANGTLNVTLDMEIPHYYIELRGATPG